MKHGWFTIPGVQTGERDFKERIGPLASLLPHARGATVLDIGCAEGLIGKWLIDAGRARLLHGIDKHEPYLETARRFMPRPKYKTRFDQCDFDHFEEERPRLGLLPVYDIVLALNVIQKLKEPRAFLESVSGLAGHIFVYSGPNVVLKDIRSGNVPVDIEEALAPRFKLVGLQEGVNDRRRGHLGVRMFFHRIRRKR